MTSKAHVEYDPARMGVRMAVTRRDGGGGYQVLLWEQSQAVATVAPDTTAPDDCWLKLLDEDARAMYEALGDYFGHSGNDVRALRRDYDAERGRVDRLIGHLIDKSHQ